MVSRAGREDKKQIRERQILHAAQRVGRDQGFLTLNVQEVAREAGVSVGTLYSHVQSKEGLVAALAVHSFRGRVATFQAISERDSLPWIDRLIAIIFSDFLFSVDHPELFAAEQLSASTAVLKTMPGGVLEWANRSEVRESRVQQVAVKAIEAGDFKPWPDCKAQATAIDVGVWTLMAGSSYIRSVLDASAQHGSDEVQIPDWLRWNTYALLVGYGWMSSSPLDDIERLATYSLREGRFLATDCMLATDSPAVS